MNSCLASRTACAAVAASGLPDSVLIYDRAADSISSITPLMPVAHRSHRSPPTSLGGSKAITKLLAQMRGDILSAVQMPMDMNGQSENRSSSVNLLLRHCNAGGARTEYTGTRDVSLTGTLALQHIVSAQYGPYGRCATAYHDAQRVWFVVRSRFAGSHA
jgi:hypothetical protein